MNDNERIYLRWRYIFVGGVLVGIPVGSLLGSFAPLLWLPLGGWTMYRIWKDQQ